MATEPLSTTLRKSGIAHDIYWADAVTVTLPGDYLPFPHQYAGINLTSFYDRCGLFDEAGCGKTLVMQANALYRVGCGNKVVVLTTPTLLMQFYDDMYETFVGFDRFVTMEMLRGTPAQHKAATDRYEQEGWPDILLMSYDLFRGSKPPKGKDPESGKKARVNIDKIGYHATLKQQGYSVLICDEAHALRNTESTIHKRIHKFIGGNDTAKAEAALVMATATPSYTHVEQCYGLIRLKTPDAYGSKSAFERLHVRRNYGSPFKEIIGYDNLDVLALNLYSQARRVEKRDVAKDMPDKIHTVVPVLLDPAHYRLYKKLMNERMLEVQGKMIDAIQDQALRQTALQLVTNPERYSDTPIKNEVFTALTELLSEIDLTLTKVIVFIHFNETGDDLMKRLSKWSPALLNGRVTDKDTPKRRFLKDDDCRLLIAHPQSAGAGLNLQSVCNNVIFYECPDSPGAVAQAEDRVHRISGTEATVNVYFLSPQATWAAKKIRQVTKKDRMINSVVGDQKQLLGDLFDE